MNELQRVGRYDIVRLLGRGGMGEVYLARDPVIDRLVALKLLAAAFDAKARERFAREARAVGRLHHEHIVTVFDVGEHQERPFIAMEYVPGDTLASLIHRGQPRPLGEMLGLLEDACVGLAYAHRAGVVHLDVKPENLIRRADGRLKILDFGISRVLEKEATQTRHALGTLRYMSPEQLLGHAVDARSDVFAVGCVLYEIVARRPAFGAEMSDALARLNGSRPPSLFELAPEAPPALQAIAEKAMAHDPADRYPDLDAMRYDLGVVRQSLNGDAAAPASGSSVFVTVSGSDSALRAGARPASAGVPPRRWRGRVAAAAVALASVAGVMAWQWRDPAPPASTTTAAPAADEPAGAPPGSAAAAPNGEPTSDDETAAAVRAAPKTAGPAGAAAGTAAPPQPGASTASPVSGRSAARSGAAAAPRSLPPAPVAGLAAERSLPAGDPPGGQAVVPSVQFDPPVPPPAPAPAREPSVPAGDAARAPLPPPAARPPATAEDGVRTTLAAYQAAYARRDVGALRRVFPGLTGEQTQALARTFEGAISYGLDLRVIDIRVGEGAATATCDVTHALVPKVGTPSTTTQRTTFQLTRAGEGWVIDRLLGGGRR